MKVRSPQFRSWKKLIAAVALMPLALWSTAPAYAVSAAFCATMAIPAETDHACCAKDSGPGHDVMQGASMDPMHIHGHRELADGVAHATAEFVSTEQCSCHPAEESGDPDREATPTVLEHASPRIEFSVNWTTLPRPTASAEIELQSVKLPGAEHRNAAGPRLFLLHDILLI